MRAPDPQRALAADQAVGNGGGEELFGASLDAVAHGERGPEVGEALLGGAQAFVLDAGDGDGFAPGLSLGVRGRA